MISMENAKNYFFDWRVVLWGVVLLFFKNQTWIPAKLFHKWLCSSRAFTAMLYVYLSDFPNLCWSRTTTITPLLVGFSLLNEVVPVSWPKGEFRVWSCIAGCLVGVLSKRIWLRSQSEVIVVAKRNWCGFWIRHWSLISQICGVWASSPLWSLLNEHNRKGISCSFQNIWWLIQFLEVEPRSLAALMPSTICRKKFMLSLSKCNHVSWFIKDFIFTFY